MKKKILCIFPTLPYPLIAGGNQAMFNGIDVVKDDVDIFVMYSVPFYSKKEKSLKKISSLLKNVHFVQFVYNPLKGYGRFVLWVFFRISLLLKLSKRSPDYFCKLMSRYFELPVSEYIDFINTFVEKNKIDIVQLEMFPTLSLALSLPSGVKKIFVHHELRYVVNDLRVRQMGINSYKNANVELAKISEIGLLNKCDAIVTLSDIDKQKLQQEGVDVPVYSSFAVVNTLADGNNPNECYNELSFVGPATHTPNFIGLMWFLENCWGKLQKQDSSYHLKIIGNWSQEKRREILANYKNVEFLGFIDNLANVLNNTIMIVPITVGSGIRMKILEASSLGIPFVSTIVGAEGLPFESGKDCFKAASPEAFVESIIKLKDDSLRKKFAQNANTLVKEKYSMEALRKNRLQIYEKVMGG